MKQTSTLTRNLADAQEKAAAKRTFNVSLLDTFLRAAIYDLPTVREGFIKFVNRHIRPNGGV